ncbi:hypothetical protein AcW1_003165 [Taiwanofungus camphoratus]|nr:hypothetical protein AcV5_001645 [Antrodia cinnamomea]KAI0922314.1 hypothetical protein AcV7_005877 [Antrodia cinnamomea]KAI0942570.1 hypothetical protein AcW1_003165 [Antrodia cinnamomea]
MAVGCSTGGFYKSPNPGESIAYTSPLDIAWDTSCMNTTAIDIYLYAPGASQPRIHEWANVDFAYGSYNTTLEPKWWNATSSVSLQLAIVPSGTPPFLATLPAGPVFTATYDASTSGAIPDAADTSTTGASVQEVNNLPTKHSSSKGKIAAAVLIPLLVVIGLIVWIYIKRSREKGREERKRFSVAVDKRMSTISTDWRPISTAGATAAIRNSMVVGSNGGNRTSSFSFGGIRPASTVVLEGGQAGIGAKGLYMQENGSLGQVDLPPMAQLRPGARTSAFSERTSRVSFAPDTRPSSEYRRTRAFHTGHVPPLPEKDPAELSPTQAEGPLSLTAEDIYTRMSVHEAAVRPSMDEVLPALSMMRTGGDDSVCTNDMLLPAPAPATSSAVPATMPAPPAPAHQITKSPIMGVMPMQPMPANVMSPDEMLRAYAERRALRSPPIPGGLAVPAPVANYNVTGMRTLYSPTTTDSSATVVPLTPESLYPSTPQVAGYRQSMAPTEDSRYDEENVQHGTAE